MSRIQIKKKHVSMAMDKIILKIQVALFQENNVYLSKYNSPNLKDNHCRNSQNYGTKPWCYVRVKNRTWDYCKIKSCINMNTAGKCKKIFLLNEVYYSCLNFF